MKKLIFALVAVVMGITANAQGWWVNGEISGFYKHQQKQKTAEMTIAPEVGYNFGNWDVAAQFGYTFNDQNFGPNGNMTGHSFKFNPFVRYTFGYVGNVGFYTDLVGKVQTGKFFDNDLADNHFFDGTMWGAGLRPGIKYIVNDNIYFNAALGFIGYKQIHDYKFVGASFDASNLAIGVTYTF